MPQYKIELEIYEGDGGELQKDEEGIIYPPDIIERGICAWMYRGDGERSYKVGDRFSYPEDLGLVCPWVVDSIQRIIGALQYGGTLPWQYPNTPYEKVFDQDGVTTEFIRCIDPTDCGIVIKIIRTERS